MQNFNVLLEIILKLFSFAADNASTPAPNTDLYDAALEAAFGGGDQLWHVPVSQPSVHLDPGVRVLGLFLPVVLEVLLRGEFLPCRLVPPGGQIAHYIIQTNR